MGLFGSIGRGVKRAFVSPAKEKIFDKFTPEQSDLLSQLMGALTGKGGGPQGGLLGEMFGEGGFDAFAAPAKRQFEEEIIPGLAQKFASTGGASLVNSSAFQQQLARAGEDLSARLGEQRGQMQQGQIGQLLGALLGPQFERFYQPEGPSGLSQGIGSVLGGLGTGVGTALGSKVGGGLF